MHNRPERAARSNLERSGLSRPRETYVNFVAIEVRFDEPRVVLIELDRRVMSR
jgi:hypothetical protein